MLRIWKRCAVFIIFLCACQAGHASNALFKTMPLENIEKLYLDGNIVVDIEFAEQEYLEIYLRKDAINDVVISQMLIDGFVNRDGEPVNRLNIREQPSFDGRTSFDNREAKGDSISNDGNSEQNQAVAVVKLYVNQLKYISANETHLLKIDVKDHYETEVLTVSLKGDSLANIQGKVAKFKLFTQGSSRAEVKNLSTNHMNLSQRNNSKVNISDSSILSQGINLRGISKLKYERVESRLFSLKSRNRAEVKMLDDSSVDLLSIQARDSTLIDLKSSVLDSAKVVASGSSKVQLGDLNSLEVEARNKSKVTYLPFSEPVIKVTKKHKSAVVRPVTIKKEHQMNSNWNDDLPIYKQLVAMLKKAILNHSYPEESALPSVRNISAELQINHITVSKAYHELLDEGLIEKRRGLGMFVKSGAIKALLNAEKHIFLNEDLPRFVQRMQQLNISQKEVMDLIQQGIDTPKLKEINHD